MPGNPAWTLELRRDGDSSSYGAYTVIFTQLGLDNTSTIQSDTDKNARINPFSN